MEGRDRRKWGRRKKGTRERGSRPSSSFAVLAYDAPPAGGEGGSIVRVVTMVEQNLNRRIELYSKPWLPPRRSFPSANQPRFSWLLVTANQPIPPRRGRAASPRFPIHARHASYRRFSNDENGEWRKDGRKPSTKKSPFRGKTKTRISRRGNTNLDSRSSSRLGRNNPS